MGAEFPDRRFVFSMDMLANIMTSHWVTSLLAQDEGKQAVPEMFGMMMPMLLIAVAFYFLLMRPQKREQAQREAMLAALKKNDRVLTIGGIIGTVANISQDGSEVTLKVEDTTRIRVIRSSIQRVMSAEGETEKATEVK